MVNARLLLVGILLGGCLANPVLAKFTDCPVVWKSKDGKIHTTREHGGKTKPIDSKAGRKNNKSVKNGK